MTQHPDDLAAAYLEERARSLATSASAPLSRAYPGTTVSASVALLAVASDLRAGLHHDHPVAVPVYEHADGGTYHRVCNVAIKDPVSGLWHDDGVLYRDASSPLSPFCATTADRWADRFTLVMRADHE